MMRKAFTFALVAVVALMASCSPLMETGAARNKKSNVLAETSYGAADMLLQQARSFMTPGAALSIGVITDMDNPNERTNFGQMVGEQLASRFVQLGYNVAAEDPAGMPAVMNAGQMTVTGRYAVARDDVLVNLRMTEGPGGKVLGAYDYSVPKTPDVRELVKTKADKESFFDF